MIAEQPMIDAHDLDQAQAVFFGATTRPLMARARWMRCGRPSTRAWMR
jgi:hypothetical protein